MTDDGHVIVIPGMRRGADRRAANPDDAIRPARALPAPLVDLGGRAKGSPPVQNRRAFGLARSSVNKGSDSPSRNP